MIKRHVFATIMALCACTLSSCSKDDEKDPFSAYEETYEQGRDYWTENGKREGVTTTETGLQYEVIEEGKEDGKKPIATDLVKCHYKGTFIDGKVFDSSYEREKPSVFSLNGVIPGWTEGLQLMKEGAKYRFVLPYYLAYGQYGTTGIPPYSTLIFEVELIEVL